MSERSRVRLAILQLLVLSLVGTLFARLWYLQVLVGDRYEKIATDNRLRTIVEPAPRGRILDDRGRAVARNRPSLVVTVNLPEVEREPDKGRDVLTRLARLLGTTYGDLNDQIQPCGKGVPAGCWTGSPYQPVPVAEDVAPDVAFTISEHREDFPGVDAGVRPVRSYPFHALGSHVVGYTAPIREDELAKPQFQDYQSTDLIGRSGLEQHYDRDLRGEPGLQHVTVNRLGRVTGEVDSSEATPGGDIVLSLDVAVQQVVEEALVHAVDGARATTDKDGKPFQADAAAGVVVEVKTGRIVAMASYPTYDPMVFVGGISRRDYAVLNDKASGTPLISRATQGLFAPGSTYKLVSTAAAVTDGGAALDASYECPSSLRVGDRTFRNFEGESFGPMSLHTALVKSCDTVYYKFGFDAWKADEDRTKKVEALAQMGRSFGFGRASGIDLPSDSSGRIVDRAFKQQRYKRNKTFYCEDMRTNPDAFIRALQRENCFDGFRWRAGDEVNSYIGQGETVVTPLQLAMAYAALANGGTVFAPRLTKAVLSPDGQVKTRIDPPVRGRLRISPDVMAYIRNALADVTTEGTAKTAFAGFPHHLLRVAGKTGTAEVSKKQDTSWFASYAPAADPRYAVVVMVEQGGQGGRVAAPAVREIYEGIYGIGRLPALPNGETPTMLPHVAPDGTVRGPAMARPVPLVPP